MADFANKLYINEKLGVINNDLFNVEDLKNFDRTVTKTSGDVLAWNDGTSKWEPRNGGGGTGEVNNGINLGTGSKVFKDKVGDDLRFRTLSSTTGDLTISEGTDEVTFTVNGVNSNINVGGGKQIFKSTTGTQSSFRTMVDTDSITWVQNTNDVRANASFGTTTGKVQDAGTAVRLDDVQTLTNKTIDGGENGNNIMANRLKTSSSELDINLSDPTAIGDVLQANAGLLNASWRPLNRRYLLTFCGNITTVNEFLIANGSPNDATEFPRTGAGTLCVPTNMNILSATIQCDLSASNGILIQLYSGLIFVRNIIFNSLNQGREKVTFVIPEAFNSATALNVFVGGITGPNNPLKTNLQLYCEER